MNWWGRRAGLSLLLVVVLLSCEEEISTIGIRRPNPKFRVNYAEIDVPSSVIRFEKLTTYNRGTDSDGIQRFLVGQYRDNVFGKIQTEIYSQISPPININTVTVGATAVLDSLVLHLKTDFYYYGDKSTSDQTIEVHELLDSIKQTPYYSTSKIPYDPTVLGLGSLTIDAAEFIQNAADNSDNISTNNKVKRYSIVLTGNFATSLFESMRSEPDLIKSFPKFTQKYKGLAIVPKDCDKILGVDTRITASTLAESTKLTMYFTEDGAQKQLDFTLFPFTQNPVLGFSSIDSDRSGSPVGLLEEPFTDYYPTDNKRYVQSGTGILTKLDLTPYFDYMDTVENAVLNSAEFVFENETSDFAPPPKFQFRVLNEENKYATFLQDTLVDGNVYQINKQSELISAYPNGVLPNADGTIDLLSDARDLLRVSSNSANMMSGFVTSFFQDQYFQKDNPKRITYCALHPIESDQYSSETQFRKSVNRLVLKDNIKLKIYYTTPVVETIE